VIAESFERIHRSNLIGMGVLPLVFRAGENVEALGLTGRETFDILGISDRIQPREELKVIARDERGERIEFKVIARLDTPVEVDYYKHGGILPTVLRGLLRNAPQRSQRTQRKKSTAKRAKSVKRKLVKKAKRVVRTRRR
jgi:aconitate hydratase